ncbi:hypothetical protein FN976_00325 [Caenimonas sedimenti]|uniref:Uncharacterized protein n=1 Tax=Caenimonas sedimenti TaxID=2596921 RepID=A0A562ZY90_9BURK|nr:hypothetical protein [Caenimonas sedimenti]TWO73328.1 hypothetical protein FN976_00325 [Caenimonas sedimenti]
MPVHWKALLAVSATLLCANANADAWSLFGRHGECAPISSLKRKLQDLPGIQTPDEFSAYLQSKRLQFTRQNLHAGAAGAVEFQVPEAGLSLVFVPHRVCANQNGRGVRAP